MNNIDIAKERNELLQIELDNEHLRDEIDKLRENRDKLEGNKDTKVKSLLNDVEDFRRYLGECRNTVRSQHDIINKLIAEKKADYDRWNRMAAHLELLKISIDEKNRQIDNLDQELSVCKRDSEMLRKVVKIVNSEKMPYQAINELADLLVDYIDEAKQPARNKEVVLLAESLRAELEELEKAEE